MHRLTTKCDRAQQRFCTVWPLKSAPACCFEAGAEGAAAGVDNATAAVERQSLVSFATAVLLVWKEQRRALIRGLVLQHRGMLLTKPLCGGESRTKHNNLMRENHLSLLVYEALNY